MDKQVQVTDVNKWTEKQKKKIKKLCLLRVGGSNVLQQLTDYYPRLSPGAIVLVKIIIIIIIWVAIYILSLIFLVFIWLR